MAFLNAVDAADLGFDEAKTHLLDIEKNSFTGSIVQLPPSQYKSGDVYAMRLKSAHDKDWRADVRGWRQNGTRRRNGVSKVYFNVIIGKNSENTNAFRKVVYTLEKPIDQQNPGLLIHYVGDDSLGLDRATHGNVKHHTRPFVRTMPSTTDKIKQQVSKGVKPQQAYENTLQVVAKTVNFIEHSDAEAFAAPRNTKQAQNFKYKEDQSKKISSDEIYNLKLLSTSDLSTFIRFFQVVPEIVVIFGEENAILLANELLSKSKNNKEVPQLISYDTTFELGDFYLSVVVMRNTDFENNPIFPVLFMIHTRKFQQIHDLFWRYYVIKLLKLGKHGQNVPITTDRERGIMNAILENIPWPSNLVLCQNHILQDVKIWLKNHHAKGDDYTGYIKHLDQLLKCKTVDEFCKLYETLRLDWSQSFLVYADTHLRHDLQLHGIDSVTSKFAAFKDMTPTNNISESLNKMVKERSEWKEMPVDVMVMVLYCMQQYFLNEFNRGYRDLGNYIKKSSVVGRVTIQLEGVKFFPLEQIVQNVKGTVQVNVEPILQKGKHQLTKKFLARQCLLNNLVSAIPEKGLYVVRSPYAMQYHAVSLGSSKPCACQGKSCYHELAAIMMDEGLKTDRNNVKKQVKLSTLSKSKPSEGKSGRKKPRKKDVDVQVLPASDSLQLTASFGEVEKSMANKFQSSPISSASSIDGQLLNEDDINGQNEPKSVNELEKSNSSLLVVEHQNSNNENADIVASRSDPTPQSTSFLPASASICNFSNSSDSVSNDELRKKNLNKGSWLASDVIETAMTAIIVHHDLQSEVLRIMQYIYTHLDNGNYDLLIFHLMKYEALNKDVIAVLIPMAQTQNDHWILGVIHLPKKCILLLDPIKGYVSTTQRQHHFTNLAKMVKLIYLIGNCDVHLDDWNFIYSSDCPRQGNGCDCGIFVLYYLFAIVRRSTTTTLPSLEGRRWVYHLINSLGNNPSIFPEFEDHSKRFKDQQEEIKTLSNSFNAKFNEKISWKNVGTEKLLSAMLPKTALNWTVCDTNDECVGKRYYKQVMCIKCRKWFHFKCERVKNPGTYYICHSCTATSWNKIQTWTELNQSIDTANMNIQGINRNTGTDKISLWLGDITKLKVDAIVNAANRTLIKGMGIDHAIHTAAGPNLQKACRKLNGCNTGDAKLTPGFYLPCDNVIHAVGPDTRDYDSLEECEPLLESCYIRSLELLVKHKFRTIAFPCISTGIYGYPKDNAANIAVKAVCDFLKRNCDSVDRIVFCVFAADEIQIYKNLLQKYFPV